MILNKKKTNLFEAMFYTYIVWNSSTSCRVHENHKVWNSKSFHIIKHIFPRIWKPCYILFYSTLHHARKHNINIYCVLSTYIFLTMFLMITCDLTTTRGKREKIESNVKCQVLKCHIELQIWLRVHVWLCTWYDWKL